jgi:hypothetical protein
MMDVAGDGKSFPCKMTIHYDYMTTILLKNFQRYTPFSLDLAEAVKCQILFARKITSTYLHDPVPESLLVGSQQRYAKFMNLIRINATEALAPALDIDLFWHTHQLSSLNYMPWRKRHVGRYINHDDTVDKTPPPNNTPAQRVLCDFDLS